MDPAEKSPFWETLGSSDRQNFPNHLRNSQVFITLFHSNQSLVLLLSQVNPVHAHSLQEILS